MLSKVPTTIVCLLQREQQRRHLHRAATLAFWVAFWQAVACDPSPLLRKRLEPVRQTELVRDFAGVQWTWLPDHGRPRYGFASSGSRTPRPLIAAQR
jgi:hypothetical protein